MKIYIPSPKKSLIGGPYSFLRNLRHTLKNGAYNIESVHTHLTAEALFFPVSFSKTWIRYYKRLGLPVIQRLDGLHYPEKHGDSYKLRNKDMADIYLNHASHLIFQSQHSENQFLKILGKSKVKNIKTITNGARDDLFYPAEKHNFNKAEIKLITTGNFRGKDMLQPTLNSLDLLHKKEEFTFTLTILGRLNYPQSIVEEISSKPYVKIIPPSPLEDIAKELRKHDLFVFSHLNPPCPNSVIESLACGVPVVSFNSGAMAELCRHQAELLAPTCAHEAAKKVFNTQKDLKEEKLLAKIVYAIENFADIKKECVKHAPTFTMDVTTKKYAHAFLEAQKKQTPHITKRLFFFTLACAEYTVELTAKILHKLFGKK